MNGFHRKAFAATFSSSLMAGIFAGGVVSAQVVMPAGSKMAISAAPEHPPMAPHGITAIAGEVVDMNGVGLPGVLIAEGARSTHTGTDGQFLPTYAIPGKGVLQIDGRAAGAIPSDHGLYQIAVDVAPGLTTILPFKSWLPVVDHAHDVEIVNPARTPFVVTHPALPGLEIRIPAGTVIRDADGDEIAALGITSLPAGKSPVPYPAGLNSAANFTIQPGASCLYDAKGAFGVAQIVLPNAAKLAPAATIDLLRYEPDTGGWRRYGEGSVTPDGQQIVPSAATVLTDFSSAECDPKTKWRPAFLQRIPARGKGKRT